jgi:hypothetical protein
LAVQSVIEAASAADMLSETYFPTPPTNESPGLVGHHTPMNLP